ncbi:MAG: hypothetical protein KAR32_06185, partial [Candidatus Omnitrophica bacterium]|nr:hypothetical protein [Candidatus Omnitrophota bacterium]
ALVEAIHLGRKVALVRAAKVVEAEVAESSFVLLIFSRKAETVIFLVSAFYFCTLTHKTTLLY